MNLISAPLLLVAACSGPVSDAVAEPPVIAAPTTEAGRDTDAGLAAPIDPLTLPSLELGEVETQLSVDGLRLEVQSWTFGADTGTAWRVRMPRDASMEVRAHPTVQDFAAFLPDDTGPWAALNGGFYARGASGMEAMGLVVSGGEVHNPLRKGGGSGIAQWGPGPIEVLHRSDWKPGATQALQSIDRIVGAGASLVNARPGKRPTARSALATSADAVWLVALAHTDSIEKTTTGVRLRRTAGLGLPLWAFADYLVSAVGAEAALNLDGAISTSLAVQTPTGRFDLHGELGTINAVVLRPAS